jgi:hypothetical protein
VGYQIASASALPGMKLRRAPKARRAKAKTTRQKPPCKYGERLKNGRCPKKLRTLRGSLMRDINKGSTRSTAGFVKQRATHIVERAVVGGTLVAAKQLLDKWRTAREAAKAAGAAGLAVRLAAALRLPVSALTAGQLGGVALAGFAAYWITSKIIEAPGLRRQERADQAFELGQAYRNARLEAADTQGQPLSAQQQATLAIEFRKGLTALGFSTSVLPGSKGT